MTATTTVNAAIAQAHNLPGLIGNPRCSASALATQLRGKLLVAGWLSLGTRRQPAKAPA
jgi:hypothetical protein